MMTRSRSLALSLLLAFSAAACSDSFDDTAPNSAADPGAAAAGAAGSSDSPPVDSPDAAADEAPASGGAAGSAPEPDAGAAGAAQPEDDAATPDVDEPCAEGTADCDGVPSNGCETRLDHPFDCGACGHTCYSGAHGTGVCEHGVCAMKCADGFANCDGEPLNGCEVELDSADTCGACGVVCPVRPHATPKCDQGVCAMSCDQGFADCNSDVSDGCEATLDTVDACGACGHACPAPAHAQPLCSNGACAFACDTGFADCDGNPSNGCEAPLDTVAHCGGCNTSCVARPHAQPVCEQDGCGIACDGAYRNCDGTLGNGCESDTSTDKASCGACGKVCPVPPNATATCAAGTCGKQCLIGFADCNGQASDGCEVSKTNDANNCGACGKKCGSANAVASCQASACVLQCHDSFADCDGTNANGCEIDLTNDPHNCGACGHDCELGACLEGVCQAWMVANEPVQPKRVAADATHVYWTTAGTVRRAPLAGGPAETIVVNAPSSLDIALSDGDVYWTSFAQSGGAYRAPKAGGAVVPLAESQAAPRAIAVYLNDVFWTTERTIARMTNGAVTTIAITSPTLTDMVVDQANAYFISDAAEAVLPDKILSVSWSGGAITTLYSGMDRPYALDVEKGYLYYVTYVGGTLERIPTIGGMPTVMESGMQQPTGLVVDGDMGVAWVAETGKKAIKEIPLTGAPSTYRFVNGGYPSAMAQNTKTIVWADVSAQRVYAMRK